MIRSDKLATRRQAVGSARSQILKPFHIKQSLALLFDVSGANDVLQSAQKRLYSPFIRAVNYHDVPPSEAKQFEQHLLYFSKHFTSVSLEQLLRLQTAEWTNEKPGLILSFDDGYRSSWEVVAPLLERYGFTGWFLICPRLIDIPVNDQPESAPEHRVFPKPFAYGDSRVFLTWDEISDLDQRHTIGCHTLTHTRLCSTLSEGLLREEIVTPKQCLEQKLKHEVTTFAWVGGEEWSYSRKAAELIQEAGYKVVFTTNSSLLRPRSDLHFVGRTNVESHYSPGLMRFQISGFMDLLYTPKRHRVLSVIAHSCL